jgi:drug/metabolite transporter (DMT)-like permease
VVLTRTTLLFLVLCAIWGTTWIGIKAGVDAVPPLLFAGSRFTTAGLILLGIALMKKPLPVFAAAEWKRIAAASVLMISLCYGPLFWGMLYVDTGTAAVLEMSLTPISLLFFALVLGEEAFDRRRLLAILLGVAGLVVLFGPTAHDGWAATSADSVMTLVGAGAVCFAAISSAWGSVLARPLLRSHSPTLVAGITTFVGGALLIAASLAFEPGAVAALSGRWGLAAWGGWLFLVIFGSLIGYSIYMRLLRDIGASRAGTFAFVSPVIAVVLGTVVYGESVGITDVAGMIVMLFAAYLAMQDSHPPEVREGSASSGPLVVLPSSDLAHADSQPLYSAGRD